MIFAILILTFMGISTAVIVTGFVLKLMDQRNERIKTLEYETEAKQWNRTYSVTKTTSDDIRKFVRWFQKHKKCANHIVEDISNLLEASCCLPALGVPFKFNDDIVLTLAQSGKGYCLTVANNTSEKISTFWKNLL